MPKKKINKSLPKLDKGQLALFVKAGEGQVVEDSVEVRQMATAAMVAADERTILAGAEGLTAAGWVYQYTQGDQTITGISYPGFRALYRRVYKTDLLVWRKFPEMVCSADDPRGPTLIVYGEICHPKETKQVWPVWAEEPLMKRTRTGSTYPNFHARAVVTGKHLRNGMKIVTPENDAAIFLAHCLKEKVRVEHLSGGGGAEKASPVRVARLNQLMSMAKGYGLNINDQETKKKYSEFLARQFKMRLSAMSDDQLGNVAQWLQESVDTHGKDAFVGAVEHVRIDTVQGS